MHAAATTTKSNTHSFIIKNTVNVLIGKADYCRLLDAGYEGTIPIVKVFVASVTYLFTGIKNEILYGYVDLSMDCVEWGSICSVDELATMKVGPFWLERDKWFEHIDGTNYLDLRTLAGI